MEKDYNIKLNELSHKVNDLINPLDKLLTFKITPMISGNKMKFEGIISDRYGNIYVKFYINGILNMWYDNNYLLNSMVDLLENTVYSWIAYGVTNDVSLSLKDAQNAAKVIYYNKYENR